MRNKHIYEHNKNTGQARSRGAAARRNGKKKDHEFLNRSSRSSSASYVARASGDPSRAQAAMTRANISGDASRPESGWWRRQRRAHAARSAEGDASRAQPRSS